MNYIINLEAKFHKTIINKDTKYKIPFSEYFGGVAKQYVLILIMATLAELKETTNASLEVSKILILFRNNALELKI